VTMSEKLERVVAEEQLRPGLLVEERDCTVCHREKCRTILNRRTTDSENGCTDFHDGACRPWLSATPCWDGDPGAWICYQLAIAEGRLFIVDVGDTVSYERELERTE
jgi:hypothetical protein